MTTPTDAGHSMDSTERSLLVEAGPGSGKTTLLVAKLVRLVDAGVAPERVLTLTFSRKAAAEVRHRFEESTRRSFGRLWITTFHSFGHALVQRFAVEAGVPRSFRLLTGFKEWVLTRDVLRGTELSGAMVAAREHRGLVGEVANALALLKHNRISPDQLLAAAEGQPAGDAALLRDLAGAFRAYEAELRRRRHFDYRDLINLALALLEGNERVRGQVQGWFDHVLLDELQDVDVAQVDLVRALVRGSPLARRTTACGDPDQSIYRFRGAVPQEALPRLLEALPDAERLRLDANHRSLPAIVAVGRRVLGRPLPEPVQGEALVDVRVCATGLAEATAIARALRRLHGQPRRRGEGTYRWRDMAVLCRSVRRDARPIENELARLGVPYRVHGNSSFYRNTAVAFLVNLILALVDEEDDAPLRRVLASPVPGLPSLPVARFLDRVGKRQRHAGRYLWFLRFLLEREDPGRFPIWRPDREDQDAAEDELARERRGLGEVRPPYFFGLMTLEEKQAFYDFHRTLLLLRGRARRSGDALPALVAMLASRSGLTDWILRLEATDPREAGRHAANLSKLQAMVQDYVEIVAAGGGATPSLDDLAGHLRELLEHFAHESEVEGPGEEQEESEDAVSLMTVHQAKGLEFDVVFVPHLAIGHFPSPPRPNVVLTEAVSAALRASVAGFSDLTSPDALAHAEDERRLFYVAVTRARERLLLSWSRRYDGDDEDVAPSPFLVEALGARELDFFRAVQEGQLTPKGVLRQLAGLSAWPAVRFIDDEAAVDAWEELSTQDELEIALRRKYAREDTATRSQVEELLASNPTLDRGFVVSPDPFPREPERPLGLAGAGLELSASRLIDHRDCPRKFYYSKILHLEAPSTGQARFGTAVHEVLRAFHEAHPDRDELLRAGARLASELRDGLERAIQAERDGLTSEFEHRRALAQARAMVEPYLAMLAQEPTRFVAGREVDLHFGAAGARLVAKLDRIGAETPTLEAARDALVADYKTVRAANPRGLTLKKEIEDGHELQLVTYYRAFVERWGRPPGYLGKIFLRHTSAWRPGTLEVLLKVTEQEPPKGDPYRGRNGRRWIDRAWIAPSTLDAAWAVIEGRIREILDPGATRFPITPSDAVCKFCPFDTVCGKEEAVDAADA
jgi:superfamily I DNA/RNA helicase